MHLICPPTRPREKKNSITFVFHFSWVLQPCQEKLKTMLMQNFEGANKVHYGASGLCIRKILIVTWPYVRLSVRTIRMPMQNNSINRYCKPKATRGFFGGKSQSHLDFYREKKQQQSRVFSTLFLMSSLTWITEKELGRVNKSKGGEFRWKKDIKFHSSGEKMRNASGQQGENERQWKKSEQEHKEQNCSWAHTTIPP